MNQHTCTFSSDTGNQHVSFGQLRCPCGRVMPYQLPRQTLTYRAFVQNRDRHPGSRAESFWFFRLPIPEEVPR